MSGMDGEGDEAYAGWTGREARHERDGQGGRRDMSGMDGEMDGETRHERDGRGGRRNMSGMDGEGDET